MGNKEFNKALDFLGVGIGEALGFLLPLKGIYLDQVENTKPLLGILNYTASNSIFKTPDLNPLLGMLSVFIGLISIITLYMALKSGNKWLNASGFVVGLFTGVFVFILIL